MLNRAQWDRCWGPKSSKIETGHLFSIVKLNFNVGLFSCIFLFEAIFLSQSAIFCRSKFGIFAHFGRFSTISQSLIWSSKYLFLSVNLNSKVEKHIKEANFAKKNQTPICLCWKVRNRAIKTFHLAPKWQKAANGGFGKFGSFQPYLTHRQLDWATMMFNETPFLGYPTCLLFAHVVWWWTALWTARTTRRRRPERSLAVGCITSVEIFIN